MYLRVQRVSSIEGLSSSALCSNGCEKLKTKNLKSKEIVNTGVELRGTNHKGVGVFAAAKFSVHQIVVRGDLVRDVAKGDARGFQISGIRFVLLSGLLPKLNHSCDPNCGLKTNGTGGFDIVAMRDIEVGEEIHIDYAMTRYSLIDFPKECRCESDNCRSLITGWLGLSDEQKKDYIPWAAPYLVSSATH